MTRLLTATLLVAGTLPTSAAWAEERPTVVGGLAEPFLVKDCTGPAAGKTLCYYCRYGSRPVIGLFVRKLNADVTRLVEQIDRAVDDHRDSRLAAFVVLLADDTPVAERELKQLAENLRLGHTPLTIFRDEPEKLRDVYGVADSSAVTALMWKQGTFTARQAFRKSDAVRTEGFLADVKKCLEK